MQSTDKPKSNIRSISDARKTRKPRTVYHDLSEKLQYHLHAEMQERIRDLEADVEELAKNQQRLQQRLLTLVRYLINPPPD